MAPVRLFTFTLDENPIIADGHCTECFMLRPLVYHRPSTINAAMSAALRENPSMNVSFFHRFVHCTEEMSTANPLLRAVT